MKYFFLLNGNIPNRPTLASGSCPWLCGMIIETDVVPWLMPAVTLRMRRYPLDHADNHHDDDDVFHDDHVQNGQSSMFDSCSKPSGAYFFLLLSITHFSNPCYPAGCLHDDPEKL